MQKANHQHTTGQVFSVCPSNNYFPGCHDMCKAEKEVDDRLSLPAADSVMASVYLAAMLRRSSIGRIHLGSRRSLELATDMAFAQLDTALQGPTSGLSPRNLHRGSLSANPAALTTLPGNVPVSQERCSNISPFAQLVTHVISPANSKAAQSAEPSAATSSSLPGQASGRSPNGDMEESHPCSDSASRMAAAVQEAEACRTLSIDDIDESYASKILDCRSSLHRNEDLPGQGGFGGATSPKKHSGTKQPPTDSFAMECAPGGPEKKAVVAHHVVQMAATGAAIFSEARAHRRRTRQVTVLPDQENLLAIQAAILGSPQSAVQKPLRSRTNLRGRHAGSLQAACDPCDGDALLRAALCTTSSWDQAGQHTWTWKDTYKPLSAQLTCTDLTDSDSKRTWAPTPNAWGATERAAAESGLERDQKLEQDRSRVGAPNAGKQWWAYPMPTYMRSTCSVRAKADVAMQQIKACKESQRDRRRWTY